MPSFRISKPQFSFSYETKHHLIHLGLILLGGWLMYKYARTYPQGTVVNPKQVFAALAMQAVSAILVIGVGLFMWGQVSNQLGLIHERHSKKPSPWIVVIVGVLALVVTLAGLLAFAVTVNAEAYRGLAHIHKWGLVSTEQFRKSGFQSLVILTGAALLLHFSWTRLVDAPQPMPESAPQLVPGPQSYPSGSVPVQH